MKLELIFGRREDGGLRVWSPTLRGFVLSHSNPFLVLLDIKPVMEVLVPLAMGLPLPRAPIGD